MCEFVNWLFSQPATIYIHCLQECDEKVRVIICVYSMWHSHFNTFTSTLSLQHIDLSSHLFLWLGWGDEECPSHGGAVVLVASTQGADDGVVAQVTVVALCAVFQRILSPTGGVGEKRREVVIREEKRGGYKRRDAVMREEKRLQDRTEAVIREERRLWEKRGGYKREEKRLQEKRGGYERREAVIREEKRL